MAVLRELAQDYSIHCCDFTWYLTEIILHKFASCLSTQCKKKMRGQYVSIKKCKMPLAYRYIYSLVGFVEVSVLLRGRK